MENQITEIECTAVEADVSLTALVKGIKDHALCQQEQIVKITQSICTARKEDRDYSAQQAAVIGKELEKVSAELSSKYDAVVALIGDASKPALTKEQADKIVSDVQVISDKIVSDVQAKIDSLGNITPEFIAGVSELMSKLADTPALMALLAIQNNIANLQTNDVKQDKLIAELQANVAKQNDINCKLKTALQAAADSLVVNCAETTKQTEDALKCFGTAATYKSPYEYQSTGNVADLAPSMVIPVLDTVITPVDVGVPAMPEVVAPEVIVEPTFVVSEDLADDGTLIEVLSNGNVRKTTIEGVTTTVNSMGDLV